jgi:trigger factor
MADNVARQPDGTLTLTLTLTWPEISAQYEKSVVKAVSEAEIPGFRKGKAPRNLIEPKLDKSGINSQALQNLLPPAYQKLIETNHFHPLLPPAIQIVKSKPGEDWVIELSTCEAPPVTAPDFRSELPKLKISDPKQKLTEILKYLLEKFQVNPSPLLINELTNHKLTELIDNLTRLGLSSDQYLKSKNLTPDNLKAQLSAEAKNSLKLDFVLNFIQETEKLADRQKTLDFLQSLV